MKFGQYLIDKNIINQSSLTEALTIQRFCKKRVGRILRDLGKITDSNLNLWLACYLNPAIHSDIDKLEEAAKSLSPKLVEIEDRLNFVIIGESENEIQVGAVSYDEQAIETLESELGLQVRFFYLDRKTVDHLAKIKTKRFIGRAEISIHRNSTDDEKISERSPYAELFRECLESAISRDASDIHIEPTEQGLDIMLRIYGERQIWKSLLREHRDPFLARVKQIVNLPLATLGKAADSRAQFTDYKVDLRANATRFLDGDKLVLRLLRQDRSFDLGNTGLSKSAVDALKCALDAANGLILIAGPTGSGKTTTLYSLLNSIDRRRYNVSTIENPVEYRLPGVNHIDISETGGMTFADALRAMMRQDPDYILVGEIRDEQTAELCLKAASTGHIVLSTIHSNGAVEIIDRLKLLGIDEQTIRSNLRFSGAQRLVQKLCPHCATFKRDNFRVRHVTGCGQCENGLVGRVAALEFLTDAALHRGADRIQLESDSVEKQVFKLAESGLVCSSELFSQSQWFINSKQGDIDEVAPSSALAHVS